MNGENLRTSNLVEYNVSRSNNKDDENSYQIVLEVTDTDSDDDSAESVFSIQAETTVSAKDSSDISTNEESDHYCSEYEVASSSDGWLHPWSFDRNISSESSPHQPVVDTAMKLWTTNAEESFSDDDAEFLESECDSDSDLSVVNCRFEFCVMCSSVNDNPAFQFCHSCYQIKKTFFPEKPLAKRKRKRNSEESSGGGGGNRAAKRSKLVAADDVKKTDPSSSLEEAGSGLVSGDSGFESLNSQQSGESQNDGISSSSSSSSTATPTTSVTVKDLDADADEKCLACFRNTTNALFLHGKTGHRCCCYPCAKRIWFESRRCPICRSKVSNIIRILNV